MSQCSEAIRQNQFNLLVYRQDSIKNKISRLAQEKFCFSVLMAEFWCIVGLIAILRLLQRKKLKVSLTCGFYCCLVKVG